MSSSSTVLFSRRSPVIILIWSIWRDGKQNILLKRSTTELVKKTTVTLSDSSSLELVSVLCDEESNYRFNYWSFSNSRWLFYLICLFFPFRELAPLCYATLWVAEIINPLWLDTATPGALWVRLLQDIDKKRMRMESRNPGRLLLHIVLACSILLFIPRSPCPLQKATFSSIWRQAV